MLTYTYTTIDRPGSSNTFADQGVGTYFDNTELAFLYSGGTYTTSNDPLGIDGTVTTASELNDNSTPPDSTPTTNSGSSQAYGINNAYQMAGSNFDDSGYTNSSVAAPDNPTGLSTSTTTDNPATNLLGNQQITATVTSAQAAPTTLIGGSTGANFNLAGAMATPMGTTQGHSSFSVTGFTTPNYSFSDLNAAAQSFADLKATGANSVVIDVQLSQASLTSTSIGYGTWGGATLQTLSELIGLAKQAGLDVWVKPLLQITSSPGNWWEIAPTDPNAWFQSYDQLIVNLAQTSQQAGASHFLMDNELNSMTIPTFNSQWTTAISEVRAVFPGQIGFNTPGPGENPGDATNNPAFNFPLYSLVDFVGLDMYPVFNSAGSFTAAEVQSGWTSDAFGQNITQALNSFFSRVNKPVYLTELGSPDMLGGNQVIYKAGPSGGPPDPQGQSVFYNSSLNYILNNFPAIKGVFIYCWDLNENRTSAQTPGNSDFDWDVFGKPAQQVLTDIYGGQQYIAPLASSFSGSVGNDQIHLYGKQIAVTNGMLVTQPQTFSTIISVSTPRANVR